MAVFAHSITIFLWVACSRKWTKVEVSLMAKIEMVKILYIYIRISTHILLYSSDRNKTSRRAKIIYIEEGGGGCIKILLI